jgi:lipopolysaccharide/colanic/teichoic acid biosynthesis glycosyltransferase
MISPILVFAIFVTYFSSPGGIFFRQIRVGVNGKEFELYKLRTMYENPERVLEQTRPGDSDITPVGSIMRRLKIDELPQLINVIKGEMSIVGPRPCLPSTAEVVPNWAKKRFEVAPGLTGLAQVNGNIMLTWEQRWYYDVEYVNSLNFFLDIKVIMKTIVVIIFGEELFGRMK